MKILSFCILACLIIVVTTSGNIIDVPCQEQTTPGGIDVTISGNLVTTADATNAASVGAQRVGKSIEDFVSPDGRIDIDALKESGYQGPLDLRGFDAQFDPRTGEPLFSTAAGVNSPSDHPDDIYWDNSMSHELKGIDGTVYKMIAFDDRLIAAGRFSVAGAALVNNIAAWDGSTWSPLGNGIGGYFPAIQALAAFDGKLVAGGGFTSADDVPVNNVAIWDGSSWAPMGDGIADTVTAFAIYNGELYAASYTGHTIDTWKGTLSKWDGSAWIEIGSSAQRTYNDLLVYDGKLIVGISGGLLAWDGTSFLPWHSDLTGSVRCLLEHDGQLFVSGSLSIPGFPPGVRSTVAVWNGQWMSLFESDQGYAAYSLSYFNDQLIAIWGSQIRSWDGNDWTTVGNLDIDDPYYLTATTIEYNGKMPVGGNFASINNSTGPSFAIWDGSNWSTPNIGFDDSILVLQTYHDKLIAGGTFQTAGDGTAAKGVAAWDGTSWSALGDGLEGPNARVSRMTIFEDKLIVAGNFALPGGTPAFNIAAWDGNNWSYLGEWTYGELGDLFVHNGQLMATERFAFGGATGGILVWDGSSWTPFVIMPQDGSEAFGQAAVFDGQLIIEHVYLWCPPDNTGCDHVGFPPPRDDSYTDMWDGTQLSRMGDFSSGGVISYTEYHGRLLGVFIIQVWSFYLSLVYEWNGEAWSYMPEFGNAIYLVNALQMHNDKLYIAGYYMYVLDEDTLQTIGSGINGFGRVMTVYKNNLIVAGDFTVAGGKVAPSIAAWTKYDTLEVALDVKPGSCTNPVNGNSAHGQGKAVLPVAIMGTDDYDVHDIDPTTVTLNGASPVRWNYGDVGAPPDDPDDECACSEAGPDGYTDLNLKFYSAEVVASLGDDNIVRVEGQLYDGTPFEGQDCVKLVGNPAMRAAASDIQEKSFKLFGNKPNPFNPITEISFYLPEAADVKLEIYNILGQHVSTLIDQSLEAGYQSVIWNGSQTASGVYYYRLQAGEKIASGRMLLLK